MAERNESWAKEENAKKKTQILSLLPQGYCMAISTPTTAHVRKHISIA